MVRVDMNPTRQAISKRRLRRRRNAARRLARLKRTQQREILAAEAARQARCVAVAKWTEAEKQRDREQAHTPPKQHPRKSVVRFSADVMITKIPLDVAQQLPAPISSPMSAPVSTDAPTGEGSSSRPAKFVTVGEDWSDEASDEEDGDPEFLLAEDDEQVEAGVQRRIQPLRLRTDPGDQLHQLDDSGAKPSGKRRRDDYRASSSDRGNMDSERAKRRPHDSSNNLTCREGGGGEAGPEKEIGLNDAAELNPTVARSENDIVASSAFGKNAKSVAVNHNDDASPVSSGSPDSRKKKKRKLNQRNGDTAPSPSQSTDGSPPAKKSKLSSKSHLAHASNASLANGNNSTKSDGAAHPAEEEEEEIDSMFDGLVKQKAARKAARAAKLEGGAGNAEDGEGGKVEGLKRDSGPRFTSDGLRIVTYAEIAADQPKGLNGPCPFDCSCCF
eukprot:GFKZ01009851.1.p1 GENE.GFKZ01009851.1~~GFKZ01009851.1.p1  ORF type:complete len:444 (-),score=83.91 GFKZ01009851.1:764-2095(-)